MAATQRPTYEYNHDFAKITKQANNSTAWQYCAKHTTRRCLCCHTETCRMQSLLLTEQCTRHGCFLTVQVRFQKHKTTGGKALRIIPACQESALLRQARQQLFIAQSASSVAVISIFTVKEQVVDNTMCSITIQWQALTSDEPQLLLFWPGLWRQLCTAD